MSMNNKNNNSWKDIIGEFSANSNVGLYLKGLEHLNTEENQKLYEEKYLPVIQGEKKENSPFLSVIIRTGNWHPRCWDSPAGTTRGSSGWR